MCRRCQGNEGYPTFKQIEALADTELPCRTEDNFELFSVFPPEIRLKIWRMADSDDSNSRMIETAPRWSSIHIGGSVGWHVRVNSGLPLLQVCHEARHELLKPYLAPFLPETTVSWDFENSNLSLQNLLLNLDRDALRFHSGGWSFIEHRSLRGGLEEPFGDNESQITSKLRVLLFDFFLNFDCLEFISRRFFKPELPNLQHVVDSSSLKERYDGCRLTRVAFYPFMEGGRRGMCSDVVAYDMRPIGPHNHEGRYEFKCGVEVVLSFLGHVLVREDVERALELDEEDDEYEDLEMFS